MNHQNREHGSPTGPLAHPRILLLFAHPAYERSEVNRALLEAAQGLPGVTVRDLYECYPDFDIDVRAEQALLTQHEWLIVQHPVFWFSTPALLKQWLDLVLEHGWAYGENGHALRGKKQLSVISSGGREKSYSHHGDHRITMVELLAPLRLTFSFCSFDVLAPFIVFGTHRLTDEDIAGHADDYRRLLIAILEDRLDLHSARQPTPLNPRLDSLILRGAEGDQREARDGR